MSAPGNLAEPTDRLIAALIDFGILLGVNIVLGGIGGVIGSGIISMLLSLVGMVVGIGYYIYFWSIDNPYTGKGQTIGKKMRGIKIVRADGGDLSVGDAVIRYIGYMVSSFVFMLGFVWIFIDANKQGWHDKIAKTYVVKV